MVYVGVGNSQSCIGMGFVVGLVSMFVKVYCLLVVGYNLVYVVYVEKCIVVVVVKVVLVFVVCIVFIVSNGFMVDF